MSEEWRDVAVATGFYEVSSLGRVRRSMHAPPASSTFPGKVLKVRASNTGYGRVTLHYAGNMRREQVHRLVAKAFLEQMPARVMVNHKDGNKMNNAASNIERITPRGNVQHAWAAGLCRPNRGSENGGAKITQLDVDRIRDARVRGVGLRAIAEVFNMTEANVSSIARGLTWIPETMKGAG